ncbi:MAG: IlvD/Edd family dehydratase [Noviherbaspirillum sp.]
MTERGYKGLDDGLTNYGDRDFARYLRRSFAKSMGYTDAALDRPVIGIAGTASDYNNCHRHFPELLQAVKRGVLAAGGLPLEFPTISLGEPFLHPTSMKFRNLMSMDVEEMVRAQPMDAVLLMGGCDKTVPAQLMGAFSAGKPAIQLVGGPMMTGRFEGEKLGACTDCRRYWARFRAGEVSPGRINAVEGNLATTAGTCAVMGTASTMACITEALGMLLPGTAAIPAVHADRLRAAEESGRRAVELALAGITPDQILTPKSFENALRILLAISGSTNALIHLTAMAGRMGITITLEQLNALSETTPVLVDLKPTGAHYMEDLNAAGGVPAVMRELRDLLHTDCMTVSGLTVGEIIERTPAWSDQNVIRPRSNPLREVGGLLGLSGSLAPNGALIKRAAADENLFEHTGRAVVFDTLEDLAERIDSPDLDVRPEDVLVLRNAGPKAAAMPEAGYIPIPAKLARQGVKDMVRISDARMSGTAYGTVVLHVSPEAALHGPLALVRDGDSIRLSLSQRSLDLLVDEAELARRRAALPPLSEARGRGYDGLYQAHVLQAEHGCDFDFLRKAGK